MVPINLEILNAFIYFRIAYKFIEKLFHVKSHIVSAQPFTLPYIPRIIVTRFVIDTFNLPLSGQMIYTPSISPSFKKYWICWRNYVLISLLRIFLQQWLYAFRNLITGDRTINRIILWYQFFVHISKTITAIFHISKTYFFFLTSTNYVILYLFKSSTSCGNDKITHAQFETYLAAIVWSPVIICTVLLCLLASTRAWFRLLCGK